MPKEFVRIRHFALLISTSKRLHLQNILQQLGTPKFKLLKGIPMF